MRIIQKRNVQFITEYEFQYLRTDTSGYSFPCNADGVIDEAALHPAGRESLALCRAGTDPELCEYGVRSYERKLVTPCIGACDCGREVTLEGFTNECECGRFYNSCGQALTHPRYWGEETGERFDDHGNYIGGGDD